jgi:hypothetical protein
MAMMKDDISHEEYRSKLANVADLAVSYINTGNGYFRMRDAFNGLAEQCGANKGINANRLGKKFSSADSCFIIDALVGSALLGKSVCIECISRLSSHSNDRLQGELYVIAEDISPRRGRHR